MKLTIESTPDLATIDGVSVRRWRGVTDTGEACDVYVWRVGLAAEPSAALAEQIAAAGMARAQPPAPATAGKSFFERTIALSRQMADLVAEHLRHCKDRDCHYDAELLGYLAHCLGLRAPGVFAFINALDRYDRQCTRATSPPKKEG